MGRAQAIGKRPYFLDDGLISKGGTSTRHGAKILRGMVRTADRYIHGLGDHSAGRGEVCRGALQVLPDPCGSRASLWSRELCKRSAQNDRQAKSQHTGRQTQCGTELGKERLEKTWRRNQKPGNYPGLLRDLPTH